ncbi:uncharacterized protein [Rutidosis leptorrhynchoides]|uniref:uncharacterized protein isoform X2 n=1 Tax=Rutidosis leptorrhynchoides TaxID=125765 RepID=UPI003A99D297
MKDRIVGNYSVSSTMDVGGSALRIVMLYLPMHVIRIAKIVWAHAQGSGNYAPSFSLSLLHFKPKTSTPLSEKDKILNNYVPIYVMLQLDIIISENVLKYKARLEKQLKQLLQGSGVDGVMCDVWWGIVKSEGPK